MDKATLKKEKKSHTIYLNMRNFHTFEGLTVLFNVLSLILIDFIDAFSFTFNATSITKSHHEDSLLDEH